MEEENNWWKYIYDFNRYPELVGGAAINPVPAAIITQSPGTAGMGVSVSFTGHGEVHVNFLGSDAVAKLTWDFGDGTPVVEETLNVTLADPSVVSHVFNALGTYTVSLAAEDSLGYIGPATTVQVQVEEVSSLSDLALTAIYGNTCGWYGDTVEHRAVVTNLGGDPALSTSLRVYLSTDTTIDGGDTLVGDFPVSALGAGEDAVVPYSATIPTDWPTRTVYVLAEVDPDNTIAETDESNNTGSRKVGLSLLPWDVNGNGSVGFTDFLVLIQAVGSTPSSLTWNPCADLNNNGSIGFTDFLALVRHSGDVESQVGLHLYVSPTSGSVPLTVTFVYEAHYFEGWVTTVEIDFDGDGTWDFTATGSSTELNGSTTHTYATPGTYVPKARAFDNNGVMDTVTGPTITVQ